MIRRHIRWQYHFRFFIARGVPLWLLSCLMIIPLTVLLIAAQPITEQFFLLQQLLPEHIITIINQTPWPTQVIQQSQHAFTLLWWIVWTLPAAAILSKLYQGHAIWRQMLTIALGQILLHPLSQHALTQPQACALACLSTTILCVCILQRKGYASLLCTELPTVCPLKLRSPARQLVHNNFMLLIWIVVMMAFGFDWITWIFLTACMPYMTMMWLSLSNLITAPTSQQSPLPSTSQP